MPVPALNTVSLQRPTPEHGTTAAGTAPFLNQPAQAARVLKPLGFRDLGNNQFEHDDGSWIQHNPSRNAWERGVGKTQFRGVPQKISEWPSIRYDEAAHGWHAFSHLLKMDATNLTAAGKKLESRGFIQVLPSYYTHADGSFVALTGGKLHTGLNGSLVTGAPAPGTRRKPSGNRPTPKHEVYKTLPFPGDWASWRKNLAVAKLPRADGSTGRFTQAQLDKVMQHLGFTQASPGQWKHPDGSEAQTSNGRISTCKFQQWRFGQFPYRRATHARQWQTETKAWNTWAAGSGQPPYPAYR